MKELFKKIQKAITENKGRKNVWKNLLFVSTEW